MERRSFNVDSSSGVPTPCDCGFGEDDLEFCFNGMIHSDLFRRIIETPCDCICHGSVIALKFPIPDKEMVLAA